MATRHAHYSTDALVAIWLWAAVDLAAERRTLRALWPKPAYTSLPPVATPALPAPPPFVPRVFISHSSRDGAFGRQLVADLRSALGDTDAVWYDAAPDPEHDDRGGLAAGDPFPSQIIHQLATRNVFVVLLSPDAVDSRWVQFEIDQAVSRYLSADRAVAVILPVQYRPGPVPDLLRIFQYVDMTTPDTYAAALQALIRQIRTGESRRVEREGEPPFDDDRLPVTPQFVGRDEDLRWALDRLQPGALAALTAINGMGGIGKTTLAAVAVRDVLRERRFPDGIAVVDCREQRDPAVVLRQVLGRFDPRREEPPATTSLARLADLTQVRLHDKRALVVLDNVEPDMPIEHVVQPLRAQGLALLVTARQDLPLAVAPIGTSRALGLLSPDEALTLFAQSAGRTDAQAFPPDERAAAERIVAALGRHTLAVKLAAGYTAQQHRPLQTYADELAADPRRALILQNGQEAVSVVLSTSYAALPPSLRRVLGGLALFATMDIGRQAAMAMAGAVQEGDAAQAIETLVARRMVDVEVNEALPIESDRERLRVHPLVRAFAAATLGGVPAGAAVAVPPALGARRRYRAEEDIARYYARYVNAVADEALVGSDARNSEGAIEWAHTRRKLDLLADLCDGLRQYWRDRSRTQERRRYLPWGVQAAQQLARSRRRADRLRLARLQLAYAELLLLLGETSQAEAYLQRSYRLCRKMGDDRGQGVAQAKLGDILLRRGDLAGAQAKYEQYLATMQRVGDDQQQGVAQAKLGDILLRRGDLAGAQAKYELSLTIRRKTDDRKGEGVMLYKLARLAEAHDDLERAEALHRESLAIGNEVQSGPDVADSLLELGRFLVARRDKRDEGCRMLREAVHLYAEMGLPDQEADAQETLRDLGCDT
jgi:tetratricopeptide (TPR) repeat protein